MPKASAPSTTLPALQQKFHAAQAGCNNRLVERAEIVEAAWIALVSQSHVFYLGPPGVAKSLTVRVIRDHIGGFGDDDYYERTLTAFSTDSNVFGGPDMLALENNVVRKATEGHTLVQAKMAFLDEIFNCNDSTLNALLTALEERIYHNDVVEQMQLWSLFSASNLMPQSTDLEALYDRLTLRHVVAPIRERGAFVQMLKNRALGPIVPVLTMDDIAQAHLEVAATAISDEVYDALADLRGDLRDEGIEPTDRRMSNMLPIIQATAWWYGNAAAEISDMGICKHGLWTTKDEMNVVRALVQKLASPLEAEAQKMSDAIDGLVDQFDKIMKDADNDQQRNRNAIELHTKLDRVTGEIEELEKRMTSGGRRSVTVDEMKGRVTHMIDTLLRVVFRIDPNRGAP